MPSELKEAVESPCTGSLFRQAIGMPKKYSRKDGFSLQIHRNQKQKQHGNMKK
jgi:hypothetical protein